MRSLDCFVFYRFFSPVDRWCIRNGLRCHIIIPIISLWYCTGCCISFVHFIRKLLYWLHQESPLKIGNVDKRMVYKLIIPGSIGAFLGATFLSNIPGEIAKPYVSIFLLVLGVYVLIRFLFNYKPIVENDNSTLTRKQSIPLGFIAGFMDATGGGGMGTYCHTCPIN